MSDIQSTIDAPCDRLAELESRVAQLQRRINTIFDEFNERGAAVVERMRPIPPADTPSQEQLVVSREEMNNNFRIFAEEYDETGPDYAQAVADFVLTWEICSRPNNITQFTANERRERVNDLINIRIALEPYVGLADRYVREVAQFRESMLTQPRPLIEVAANVEAHRGIIRTAIERIQEVIERLG